MRTHHLEVALEGRGTVRVPVHAVNTLIIGAGVAALKCAETLRRLGTHDIAIVVDRLGNGTSNNSGSDKQTYYKMGVFGDEPDSPMEFARTLFGGGMMHGDIAYIEGLGSLPAFFDLCRLGVGFPQNRYGAYVGYKTDHDPKQRATSAGPKTSMMMFQRLLGEVRRQGTRILDRHEAVRLLVSNEPQRRIMGALCINKAETFRPSLGLVAFNATNVVMGTGGPGELYATSVWPHGQIGSHGLALEAGAAAHNLTELQFGMASVGFRWNLSGTYQQVVPDYFSTGTDGESDRRFFLHQYFSSMSDMASAVFLKGYQWPFHAARLQDGGSSVIDMAVHLEREAGRRVFLDFSKNITPSDDMVPFSVEGLHDEARQYLLRSGAVQATPFERLEHMNPQSIDLYAEHEVDLREPLEIAVCAQHCNGGIVGNAWWETTVPHLFAVGELAGTHGVRPGGSALNSGQVGAVRAAQLIAAAYADPPLPPEVFHREAGPQIRTQLQRYSAAIEGEDPEAVDLRSIRADIQSRMSRAGAFVRSPEEATSALREATSLWRRISRHGITCPSPRALVQMTENRLLALTSVAFLQAMVSYIEAEGGSRGGYMIVDPEGDLEFATPGGTVLRYRSENVARRREILELRWDDGEGFTVTSTPVRPLPQDGSWFETVWNDYTEGRIITPE